MKKEGPLAIIAATDGACSGNPGPGGWAGLIRFDDGSIEEFGGREESTTNNRMELKAALETLERLKNIPKHPNLILKTDSKYLLNGLSEWMGNWKKKGWQTSNGKAVLNQDLWKALDKVSLKYVKMEYIKGHSGDIDNERVDEIAVGFSKNFSIKLNTKRNLLFSNVNNRLTKKNKDEISIENTNTLENLLSNLDLINTFVQKGYWLNLEELSELTNIPINKLKLKSNSWTWRQWIIEPTENELWKIVELKKDSTD